MKALVVGLGQCGGRIADEFARLNSRARRQRGMEIITGAFAVNTDASDLSGLETIGGDFQHRILIGARRTGGHGVGKIIELGAEVAREDGDKIVDAVRTVEHFFETDAFFLSAGVAGGTGSGSLPVVAQMLRARYPEKPIYALCVLPFSHEEQTEERTVYNVATCLKSTYQVVDAVFLIDNQRFIKKDFSVTNNMAAINAMIAQPFYNLLCAGEELDRRYIGAKMVDAGDIIQSLSGGTIIGYGASKLPRFNFFSFLFRSFLRKREETHRGTQAMDQAISEMSLECPPSEARRCLYLLSGPGKEMNLDLIKELADYLRTMSPQAVIRNGDYPRGAGFMDITLILSGLQTVERVKTYYERASGIIRGIKGRRGEVETRQGRIDDIAKDIPSL